MRTAGGADGKEGRVVVTITEKNLPKLKNVVILQDEGIIYCPIAKVIVSGAAVEACICRAYYWVHYHSLAPVQNLRNRYLFANLQVRVLEYSEVVFPFLLQTVHLLPPIVYRLGY